MASRHDKSLFPSSCKSWTAKDAENNLSVKFLPAPFGESMKGKNTHESYLTLLHDFADIQIPDEEKKDTSVKFYTDIFSYIKNLDVEGYSTILSRKRTGSGEVKPVKRKRREHSDGEEKIVPDKSAGFQEQEEGDAKIKNKAPEDSASRKRKEAFVGNEKVMAVIEKVEWCFRRLKAERQKLKLDFRRGKYDFDFFYQICRSHTSIWTFVESVGDLLKHSTVESALNKCDEDSFRQIFSEFGNIFDIHFRFVSSFAPLIVHGDEVVSKPDLIYERADWLNSRIVIVSVVEEIDTEEEDDSASLPDGLRGQHACQLVKALPASYTREQDCMLGFIVQATKVRLTCLRMKEDHRQFLEKPDFCPDDFNAFVYYTRAYDMLNASDRNHLIYIMVTLSGIIKRA